MGNNHPRVATTLNNLAALFSHLERFQEAEEPYTRALKIVKSNLGPEHPYVARANNNIAANYFRQQRYTEAKEYYSKSRILTEKIYGKKSSTTRRYLL